MQMDRYGRLSIKHPSMMKAIVGLRHAVTQRQCESWSAIGPNFKRTPISRLFVAEQARQSYLMATLDGCKESMSKYVLHIL